VEVIPSKFKRQNARSYREDEEGFVTCGKLLPIIIHTDTQSQDAIDSLDECQ
jgi:hypothetical protein